MSKNKKEIKKTTENKQQKEQVNEQPNRFLEQVKSFWAKINWSKIKDKIKPLFELKKPVLTDALTPIVKPYIGIIYVVGSILALISLVGVILSIFNFGAFIGKALILVIWFVVFRMWCEMFAFSKK